MHSAATETVICIIYVSIYARISTFIHIHIHTYTQMRKAGLTNLISAFSRYGGSDVVAKRHTYIHTHTHTDIEKLDGQT